MAALKVKIKIDDDHLEIEGEVQFADAKGLIADFFVARSEHVTAQVQASTSALKQSADRLEAAIAAAKQ